jgi:hypothetical protein
MPLQVVPIQLLSEAEATDSLAAQLAAIPLGATIDGVPAVLPGGTAPAAAARLADTWRSRMRTLDADLGRYAAALRGAAGSFDSTDQSGAGNITQQYPGTGDRR